MTREEIINLLNTGENVEVEFKESRNGLPNNFWDTYSSFCNTNGGKIILGIEENEGIFSIIGVKALNDVLKNFWNTINNRQKVNINVLSDKNINIINIEKKDVIIISVPRVSRKERPVYINNNPMTGTFKRNFEGDYKCTEKEIKTMIAESSETTKDTMILENVTIEDINKETLENYRKRFKVHKGSNHVWNNLADDEFLTMIGAIDRKTKNFTMAGLLIFGNEEDIVKVATNYFLDYRETLEPELNERWSHRITSWEETWSGNLFDFYYKIVNRLTADIEVPFALDKDMTRIEDTEIHKCVREALVNNLVHSQYFESGSIVIEKGQDYFKFANPGDMRVPFERAKQGGESDPRNRLIHKIFSLIGLGERAGSGLYKIANAWKEKGWVEPKIEQLYNPDRTILTLIMKKDKNYPNSYPNSYSNNYPNEINDMQMKILEVLKNNSTISVKQVSEIIKDIKYDAIRWNINELKKKGILERIGNTRKGIWIIK